MRNWYASINASPGFIQEAFNILKTKVEAQQQNKQRKIRCNLICDEMSIRRHAQFNVSTKKFDSFVDVGAKVPVKPFYWPRTH